MPIYDLSYRHWEGPLRGAGMRWWVIAEAGIRLLLSYKRFIFLLMLCWIPFFIQAFVVYLTLVRDVVIGFNIGPAGAPLAETLGDRYLEANGGRQALQASLSKVVEAMGHVSGTVIIPSRSIPAAFTSAITFTTMP